MARICSTRSQRAALARARRSAATQQLVGQPPSAEDDDDRPRQSGSGWMAACRAARTIPMTRARSRPRSATDVPPNFITIIGHAPSQRVTRTAELLRLISSAFRIGGPAAPRIGVVAESHELVPRDSGTVRTRPTDTVMPLPRSTSSLGCGRVGIVDDTTMAGPARSAGSSSCGRPRNARSAATTSSSAGRVLEVDRHDHQYGRR